ncbi:integrase arm-type DNA-binding domain-containing protein [Roseococcus sp. SDR]|uniref:tyrosine-type recombinase/integrase n=1 Tax=Roseococcus sp. SDR TaxID=2835532 RepID=UPI001BCD23B8|nr:site-specific integrase [Roseococcus sp. SDR]MBS7790086.1 integrase arm-type DNA-binding domain-containing protein [Roseococcus sp. SDR]MBV1845400.1 integrase arm-type DNA-binding domain-containing protein [Roseococcus sp. SDR]
MAGKLTAKTVEALTAKDRHTVGRHTDGGGLHLHIRADGRAGWVLRYRLHGRQRDMSLGGYPDVSLKAAREAADAARQSIKAGRDPIRERQREVHQATESASKDRTFKAAMESAIASREGVWKNEKHKWQWRATLEKHALPILGELPVSEVAGDDVMRVLRPIWAKTPETASRLRGRIETVLDHAHALKWRQGENPARWRGHLSELLPNPSKLAPVQRQPALPWPQVPEFLVALRGRRGMAALALEFAILTAARTGEVRGATWGEIDMAARVWTVPAARMKAGEMHRVPLSDAAMDVLNRATVEKPRAKDVIFPNTQNNPLSDMALTMLVRGMATDGLDEDEPPRWRDLAGRVIVPHGFRSAFRDWCGETRPEGREVAERALAHVVRGVEAAYARSDLLERRRPLMQAWGAFCAAPAADIVSLDQARSRQAG